MSDAPERIWLGCQSGDVDGVTLEAEGWSADAEPEPNAEWVEGPYEYLRADLAPDPALFAEVVGALREAKPYLVHEASGSRAAFFALEKVNAILAKLEARDET